MAMHAAPPVAALVAPVHMSARVPMQVDPDAATLAAQPYLRLIRWVGVTSPINTPVVAVLDTGVQQGAAGLQGRISATGAMSFVSGGNALVDPEGHGTHVAGIIATVASGTATSPGVSILPVQIADAQGSTSAQALASGIRYAISRGAKVINLSVQGAGYSKVEQSAIDDATRAGALVIAASGNTGTDAKEYPGAYRHVSRRLPVNRFHAACRWPSPLRGRTSSRAVTISTRASRRAAAHPWPLPSSVAWRPAFWPRAPR